VERCVQRITIVRPDLTSLSSKELVKELISDGHLLLVRQLELARLEARQQLKQELRMAGVLSVGGAIAYAAVILLLVAAALAAGAALGRPSLGALLVAGGLGVVAAVTGAVGWALRVRAPLPRSVGEVKKELAWARHLRTT